MKIKMFATLDKVKRDTGNIKGLELTAVKHSSDQTAVVAGATNDRA
jgi:hypothetical protein